MIRNRPADSLGETDSLIDSGVTELIEQGIVKPPRARLDLRSFLAAPRPRLPKGHSASHLIVKERSEGR